MRRILAAAALAAATMAGGALLAPAQAAVPGPSALPDAATVEAVDPEVAGVENVGRRWRGHRRFNRGPSFSLYIGPRPYPYYYGGYAPRRRCVVRHREVWTRWGWDIRPVRVCRSRSYGYY